MPANTTRAGLPYPLGTDPVSDGDDAIKNLANRLDGSTGSQASVPFAIASGTVSAPAPGAVPGSSSVAVTFPAGRFTQIPNAVATTDGSAGNPSACTVSAPTTSGMNIFKWQLAGTAGAATVRWVAIQMTSTASNG